MKISSGILKGLNLSSIPSQSTRPSGAKLRQAVFNSLVGDIEDADFLDLFSGSGAIGLEAISRGARSCTLVENSSSCFKYLKQNVANASARKTPYPLCIRCIKEDVTSFLKKDRSKYDIIWADPPYSDTLKFTSLFNQCICGLLKDTDSLLVIESLDKDKSELQNKLTGFELLKTRVYGISAISFFKPKSLSDEK